MEYVLILFFSFLVEAIIAWQYAESLFTPKYTIRSRILLLGTLYFILFLFSFFFLSFWFFETGFLCVALAVLELTL